VKHVRPHLLKNFRRWEHVQRVALRYGFDTVIYNAPISRLFANLCRWRNRSRYLSRLTPPERLRLMLEELGPTYVKLGQVIASRGELLPPRWTHELSKLHNRVLPFSSDQVCEVINDELGDEPKAFFTEFDSEPIAAASMAQVHRAVLPNGEKVVVKVQRPNIEDDINADLEIIHAIVSLLEQRTSWAGQYNLTATVEEFSAGMKTELDSVNEARNAQRLARNMDDVPGVHVPTIYHDLVTPRILTMERIEGVKITDTAAIDAAGLDRKALAVTFIRAVMKQILIDGFFHADPHPGNVLVTLDTGVINFLDMGLVGFIVEEQRSLIISLIFALQERDARALAEVALDLGIAARPVDSAALRRDIDRFMNRHLTTTLADLEFSRMMMDMMNLMRDHDIRFPSELTLALKALAQAEEIARALDPQIDIIRCAAETGQGLLADQMTPQNLNKQITRGIQKTFRHIPKLQHAANLWLEQLESGKLTIHVDNSDIVTVLRGYRSLANRAVAGLILAGMIVGSTIAMSISPAHSGAFIPVIGAVGFVVAMFVGLLIVLRLLLVGETV
jgi:ubiquinone biosynthesis protein